MIAIKLIAVAMLLTAVGYDNQRYHLLMRCAVCLVSALTADSAMERKKDTWAWTFCLLALLFNPLIPPPLGNLWLLVDILAALLLLASILSIDRERGEPIQRVWIKQKRAIMWWTALAAALLYLAGFGLWAGLTHVGPGVLRFGGDGGELGTGGTEEFEDVVPEGQYKHHFLFGSIMFFVFGGMTAWHVLDFWSTRRWRVEHWKDLAQKAATGEQIRKDWLYGEDFKQWMAENHPNLLSAELREKYLTGG
jgi:hypothetical protein